MALDRVKPLKIESSDSGGMEDDQYPTSLDPQEDHVECAGVIFDDPDQIDESTVITRVDADMLFKDGNNTTYLTLTQLLEGGITEAQHDAFRQLIHFLDDGPGTGWTSGTYKETTPTGPFPTSEIWWTTPSKTQKILELTTTYNANKTPATETWKMYDATGTLLVTLVDTISYSGVFETTRTRTWS